MANRYFLNIGVNYNATANWSATSGGAGGASVPTNADDVFFDANSGNCTVNVASVAKSVNFTGYTNTITMTSTLTVSGSVTLVAAMTIAGASGLTINATATLTSNGKTWSNALTFSGAITITLADDFSVTGLLTIQNGTVTLSGSFTISVAGGLTLNANPFVIGTGNPIVNLTGGIWSTLSGSNTRVNVNINGNVTFSGSVNFGGATLKYISGTPILTGSTLVILTFASTLDLSGITLNNFTITNTTATLSSNLNIGGNFTANSGNTTLNGFTCNISGNLTVTQLGNQSGTTNFVLNGTGIWSHGSTGALLNNLTINTSGTITISGNIYYNTGTLTYTSGLALTTGSTLLIQAPTTFNTNIMFWNNISYSSTASTTLLSDLNIGGLYTTFGTFNGTFNINCYGGIRPNGNLAQGTGTTTLNLIAGTWSSSANYIQINTNIAGNISISGTVYFMTATLTYLSGKPNVLSGSILSITTCTLINIDKINWRTVQINAGATITMNKFFSGSALIPTRIQSSTTTNYTITFQDGFEKITKFTKISNCTVTNRGQLLCITDKSNKGGNVGIRYINQSPNGIAKNAPTLPNPMAYGLPSFLDSDPNFITG